MFYQSVNYVMNNKLDATKSRSEPWNEIRGTGWLPGPLFHKYTLALHPSSMERTEACQIQLLLMCKSADVQAESSSEIQAANSDKVLSTMLLVSSGSEIFQRHRSCSAALRTSATLDVCTSA